MRADRWCDVAALIPLYPRASVATTSAILCVIYVIGIRQLQAESAAAFTLPGAVVEGKKTGACLPQHGPARLEALFVPQRSSREGWTSRDSGTAKTSEIGVVFIRIAQRRICDRGWQPARIGYRPAEIGGSAWLWDTVEGSWAQRAKPN